MTYKPLVAPAGQTASDLFIYLERNRLIYTPVPGANNIADYEIRPEQIVYNPDDGYYYIPYGGTGGNATTPRACGLLRARSPLGPYSDLGAVSLAGNALVYDAPHFVRTATNTWYCFAGVGANNTDVHLFKSTTGIVGSYSQVNAAIVARGAAGKFDEVRTHEPFCAQDPRDATGATWLLFYMGFDAGNAHEQVGLAISTAGIEGPYTKQNSGNPVLPVGAAGSYDELVVADPAFIYRNGVFWITYAAGAAGSIATTGAYTIAMATSTDLSTFIKRGIAHRPNHVASNASPMSATWRGSLCDLGDGRLYLPHIGTDDVPPAGDTVAKYAAYMSVIDPGSFITPRNTPWTRIEAESADASLTKTGTWSTFSFTGASGASGIFSTTTGDHVAFAQTGRRFRVGGHRRAGYGIMTVKLDGVVVAQVDQYISAATSMPTVVWDSGDLGSSGSHTVDVSVSGNKNAASAGTNAYLDYFEYIP